MNVIRFPRTFGPGFEGQPTGFFATKEGVQDVEASAALAQAGGADEAIVSTERLLLAVAEFSEDQLLTLAITRAPSGRLGRFEMRLGGSFASAAGATAALDRIARLVASSSCFKPAQAVAPPALDWVQLAPRGEAVHAGTDAGGVAQHVLVAPCLVAATDFVCALNAAEAAGVRAVEIQLRSRSVSTQELLAINQALHRMTGATRPSDDYLAAALHSWSKRGGGVAFGVRIGAETQLDPADLDAIALALFGRARAKAAEEDSHTVDLRMAVPLGAAPAWRFWPTGSDLRRPRNLAHVDGGHAPGAVTLGSDGAGDPVYLQPDDRMRHLFVLGGTGVGKTTSLGEMIREDVLGGQGIVLIDPHGELADKAQGAIPPERRRDYILVDPSDQTCSARLDLLTTPGVDVDLERNFIVNQLITLLSRQLYAGIPEAFGPAFENYFRNLCFLLMSAKRPEERNLLRLQDLFADRAFRDRLIEECNSDVVRAFFRGALKVDGEHAFDNFGPYISSKLAQFAGNPVTRRFLDTTTGTAIDFRAVIDQGKILVVRLPKGILGDYDARILGALLLMKISEAAMSRVRVAPDKRRPSRIYVDEFQTLATRSAAEMLAECRKYGLSLTLANQSLSQLSGGSDGADVAQAALANCGTLVLFRVGVFDAAVLDPFLAPAVRGTDLLHLGVGEMVVRRLAGGVPQPAQRLHGKPPTA